MLKTLEKQLSIPYMFLSDIEIMPEAVAAVPIFLAERYTLVPLKKRWQPSDDSDERSDKFLCD